MTKPAKEVTDSLGRRKVKGNMDIELAVDALEMAPHLDHAVLFSGDGDFRRVVEAVQRRGCRVTVVSTIRSQPPMVADELRRQADYFMELQDLEPLVARYREDRGAGANSAGGGGAQVIRTGPSVGVRPGVGEPRSYTFDPSDDGDDE